LSSIDDWNLSPIDDWPIDDWNLSVIADWNCGEDMDGMESGAGAGSEKLGRAAVLSSYASVNMSEKKVSR
jgi:hypothetical protein